VSAHWEEKQVTLMTGGNPPLLFDYSGFPAHTYKLTWPAPGPPPALVERVQGLLAGAGVPTRVDASRGFDHGVFVPLKLSFPRADVPVLQLSLHASLDPALHARVGAALAPLRREGVLIVGSGFLTHNMCAARGPGPPVAWARDFEAAVDEALGLGLRGGDMPGATGGAVDWRAERLAALSTGPHKALFRQAHPREEHFTPILVAAAAGLAPLGPAAAEVGADGGAAAATPAGRVKKIYEQTVMGSFVLSSYRFDGD
jgi:aromatic ring-opening dioxygenase catalytic subunit (LigB family)